VKPLRTQWVYAAHLLDQQAASLAEVAFFSATDWRHYATKDRAKNWLTSASTSGSGPASEPAHTRHVPPSVRPQRQGWGQDASLRNGGLRMRAVGLIPEGEGTNEITAY
jgi:hypothetical protein